LINYSNHRLLRAINFIGGYLKAQITKLVNYELRTMIFISRHIHIYKSPLCQKIARCTSILILSAEETSYNRLDVRLISWYGIIGSEDYPLFQKYFFFFLLSFFSFLFVSCFSFSLFLSLSIYYVFLFFSFVCTCVRACVRACINC